MVITAAPIPLPQGPADQFSVAPQHPVGAIVITNVDENPGTTLGYGTWAKYAAGRVLVGVDTGDADFSPVGIEGGAKTVYI